jgi:sec-independent protein translocase protein TatA
MVGGQQLLIILAIILVLFGGAKLPQLARSLGQAQKEFQKGVKQGAEDDEADTSDSSSK